MVGQFEGDAGSLLKGTVDVDNVINLRLACFKNGIELPSTSTALVNDQLSLCLERFKRLESHVEVERVHSHAESIIHQVKGNRPIDHHLILSAEYVHLVTEGIVFL